VQCQAVKLTVSPQRGTQLSSTYTDAHALLYALFTHALTEKRGLLDNGELKDNTMVHYNTVGTQRQTYTE
jgi:hypothetical protein